MYEEKESTHRTIDINLIRPILYGLELPALSHISLIRSAANYSCGTFLM